MGEKISYSVISTDQKNNEASAVSLAGFLRMCVSSGL